jgi:CheY-like chemotaxis protein
MMALLDQVAKNVNKNHASKIETSKRHNILIVDDETDICYSARSFISRRIECDIDLAFNGRDALEAVKNKDYTIMFLDMSMPGMNGLDVLKQLKETNPQIKVVVITAWHSSDVANQCYQAGAREVLSKPIGPEVIVSKIKALIPEIDQV